MLQGIYTAAAGMLAHEAIADVINNNLANVNTPGFRQDFATFHMAAENGVDKDGQSVLSPMLTFKAYTNFDLGSLKQTEHPLDVALVDNGDNFFSIQTPQGVRYTRAGNFALNAQNMLVTPDQNPVLGTQGPIHINGNEVLINESGDVIVDGNVVDRLQVVQFDRVNGRIPLQKEGYTLFKPISDQSVPRLSTQPRLKQGALEGANVGMVYQMAQMIHIARGFEAYQRSIQVADSSLNTLIQRVGGA